MAQWGIPLAALILAGASLLYTALTLRRSASSEYVHSLEARIERLERELSDSERRLDDARKENIELMRQLFHATGGRRQMIPEAGEHT